MDAQALLSVLSTVGKLKDMTRHCINPGGRQESVAEHSFRIALMAYFIKDEFPDIDETKLIIMCLIHDLGEAFTGDIPTFVKTKADEKLEDTLLSSWVNTLPSPYKEELKALYEEMNRRESKEAKIYKALDNLEALISHNESDISTWSDNEYQLNLTYADDKVAFSEYLMAIREQIRDNTIIKIEKEKSNKSEKSL